MVELNLPMPVQRVYAHENIKEDQGRAALMRGPLVYCLEAADHPGVNLNQLALPKESDLHAEHRAGLLGGLTVITGKALADGAKQVPVTAIPCYAWANREKGAMTIWIEETHGDP